MCDATIKTSMNPALVQKWFDDMGFAIDDPGEAMGPWIYVDWLRNTPGAAGLYELEMAAQ